MCLADTKVGWRERERWWKGKGDSVEKGEDGGGGGDDDGGKGEWRAESPKP